MICNFHGTMNLMSLSSLSRTLLRLPTRLVSQQHGKITARMLSSRGLNLFDRSYISTTAPKPFPPPVVAVAPKDDDPEESFYRYTSGRWLYREAEQLQKRYLRFNIPALKQIAADAVNSTCVSMVKLIEGSSNKVFLLGMSNGQEVIAKIPNPNVGVAHLTTASEVATLDFLRTILHLPVPKVLAWESHTSSSNPVGAEYIIMEKAAGIELTEVWRKMSQFDKYGLVDSVVKIEKKLADANFSKYGSLYYAEGGRDSGRSSLVGEKILTDVPVWLAKRSLRTQTLMNLEGTSFEGYFTAVVKREIALIMSRTKLDPSSDSSQSRLHVELLEKFLCILPHIIPGQDDFLSPTLWHTDLEIDNIFVEPSNTSQITAIIDWQELCLAPFFRQVDFADAFNCRVGYYSLGVDMPQLHKDINPQNEEEKQEVESLLDLLKVKKFYETVSRMQNPRLFRAMDKMDRDYDHHLVPSVFMIVEGSARGGHVLLRYLLIHIVSIWNEVVGAKDIPCPISFSQDEVTRSAEEIERWRTSLEKLDRLRTEVAYGQGLVTHDTYQEAKEKFESCREQLKTLQDEFIAAGGSDFYNVV